MKRTLTALGILLAIAAGGYLLSTRYTGSAQALQVVTAPVTRGDVVQTIDATGRLEAVTMVQVGTQVSGTIKALYADFNSRVRQGQVVAELEPSLFETQVEQARATVVRLEADAERARVQYQDAQVKLARARDLAARQLVPATDLETAEANARAAEAALKAAEAQIVQAQASLNQARVNLSHTVIRAPIDGVVISRNVDVGQTVAASMQAPVLFQIANDLSRMQVTGSVDEADIGRVRAGQRATFQVDAYPGETFSGSVSQVRLNPVIESNVVSYVTVIDVSNMDLRLRPGMTATVVIEVARTADTLRVPAAALRFAPTPEVFAALGQPLREQIPRPEGSAGGNRPIVWVLADGRLEPVAVRPGITDGANVAVSAGMLEEGMLVATGVQQSAQASAAPARSPLLPFGGRGPGAGRGLRGAGAGQGAGRGGQ
ncbi:MAG: efflux RND transporter periplasmic adaptor subunit [Acidobacteria bacterium]|nr:efflux RND transporter periplasmic adaptor subunit [Acidobacteriota bacterium]